jgi:hypothetical protein
MEYVILGLILLGAVYLLYRFGKTETECHGASGGCEQCSRAASPSAERLYQIDPVTPDTNSSHNKPQT